MLLLGPTMRAELSVYASRAHFALSRLVPRRRYSTTKLLDSEPASLLSRPFEDFFESSTDTNAGITSASFEPFAKRGLPLLVSANLVNETLLDTYEITEKGNVVLQELEKRMDGAKSNTDLFSSFFGSNFKKDSSTQATQLKSFEIFKTSKQALKALWTNLGASIYEVEEPTYLRPPPTGAQHHLYVAMQDGLQNLIHCPSCSVTQLASYALTKPKSTHSPNILHRPSRVDVGLSSLRNPMCDVFYALVTRIGAIPHEERIQTALLASCSVPAQARDTSSSGSVPARILVDDTAEISLSGPAAQLWFDRLRLSMEKVCPRVMNGRVAELDRHLGRVFVATAPGASSIGSPSSLVPHHTQASRGRVRGFILGNFRAAGNASEELCLSCSGPLESIQGAWVAKVALGGSEPDNQEHAEQVTVRVLNPLPMLAALAATGILVS